MRFTYADGSEIEVETQATDWQEAVRQARDNDRVRDLRVMNGISPVTTDTSEE